MGAHTQTSPSPHTYVEIRFYTLFEHVKNLEWLKTIFKTVFKENAISTAKQLLGLTLKRMGIMNLWGNLRLLLSKKLCYIPGDIYVHGAYVRTMSGLFAYNGNDEALSWNCFFLFSLTRSLDFLTCLFFYFVFNFFYVFSHSINLYTVLYLWCIINVCHFGSFSGFDYHK